MIPFAHTLRWWLCLLFSGYFIYGSAQVDSLDGVLKNKKNHDTIRLNAALQLAASLRFTSPGEGIKYSNAAIGLSKKTARKKQQGEALHYLASSFYQMAEYDSSEKYNRQALSIREKIKDEKGMAGSLTNLGQLLADQGDIKTAFAFLHRAEKMYEKLKEEKFLAVIYNSLGNLYYNQKVYKLAYEYHRKALTTRQKLGDIYSMAFSYNNLGHVAYYLYGAKSDTAAHYYSEAIRLARETEDVYIIVQSLNNLGSYYYDIKETKKSREVLKEAIDLAQGTDFEKLLANAYINYGRILFDEGKNAEALQYALKGIKYVEEAGLPDVIFQAYALLGELYAKNGDYKNAFKYVQGAFFYKDTLIKKDVQNQITELEARFENDKKKLEIKTLTGEKKLKEKELLLKNNDINRKNILLVFSVVAALLFVTLGLLAFRAYRQKKKDSILIQAQKVRVEEQNTIIIRQKELVEEKQKEVMDSINYAQRIQQALLPQEEEFARRFTYSFILFKPKDIVSGDFYWITEKNGYIFYATADCTGHGVPGGFMSMLGTSFLNEIINEKNIIDPGKVLNILRERVIAALRQTGTVGENKDGMDIVLCRINKERTELVYAAANNGFYIFRNGEMLEQGADKMPIGYFSEMKPFTTRKVNITTGDVIYTFTDGFADQFGGPKGKKFKYGQLNKSLNEYSRVTTTASGLESVKSKLHHQFEQWKGDFEQTDDVCIIGVYV
ncbi:MAG: tetratricopeptide repeat protein [Flavobacteriales bacterium]